MIEYGQVHGRRHPANEPVKEKGDKGPTGRCCCCNRTLPETKFDRDLEGVMACMCEDCARKERIRRESIRRHRAKERERLLEEKKRLEEDNGEDIKGVFLDELDPERGRMDMEIIPTCSFAREGIEVQE